MVILARRVLVFLGVLVLAATPGWTQPEGSERSGFWGNLQLGYGSLELILDPGTHERQGALALGFDLGGTLNRYVRLGAELKGWLLEGYDLNDPEKGESVSQILAVAQFFPRPASGLFLKAGAGRDFYTNHHPLESGGSGWGGTLGAGYDLPVARRVALTPMISYSQGDLGRVEGQPAAGQSREYRVFEVGIALTYP